MLYRLIIKYFAMWRAEVRNSTDSIGESAVRKVSTPIIIMGVLITGLILTIIDRPTGVLSTTIPQGRSENDRHPNPVAYRAVLLGKLFISSVIFGASPEQCVGDAVFQERSLTHAIVWRVHRPPIDLNPRGFAYSIAYGTDGRLEVGVGNFHDGRSGGALLWHGMSRRVVLLNPPGYAFSQAMAVARGEEVGYVADSSGRKMAAIWHGSAASFRSLNPKGFVSSCVSATDGKHQVGYGELPGGAKHALVWSGTAVSAVDLNPADSVLTEAVGVCESQVVGFGKVGGVMRHALLWRIDGHGYVDLNPKQYATSAAYGTNGVEQVGLAFRTMNGSLPRAIVWCGSANSAINLQKALPTKYGYSRAYAVNAEGDIFGMAGTGIHTTCAVEWIPIHIKKVDK